MTFLDVDECEERIHSCGYGAECVNKPGSHECSCPVGHTGDPHHGCSRSQQKCIKDSDCSLNENCIQPGVCVCPVPYYTDVLDNNLCKSMKCLINIRQRCLLTNESAFRPLRPVPVRRQRAVYAQRPAEMSVLTRLQRRPAARLRGRRRVQGQPLRPGIAMHKRKGTLQVYLSRRDQRRPLLRRM